MYQISLADAKDVLAKLIKEVQKGEEILILQDEKPVAKLTSIGKSDIHPTKKIKAGSAKGLIKIAENFDEPLEDFKEYME